MATTTAPDGTNISYESINPDASSAVVLVHGITECAEVWRPVTDRLSADHHVVAVDLRGHGESGNAATYDLEAMAGDIITVATQLGLDRPHLVGHSLGGVVVSAVGAALPVASVVNVDQSLQLDEFKGQLVSFETQLRDPDAFPLVIDGLFSMMAGAQISEAEMGRVNALRRPDQDVVLGVWELILTSPIDEIEATVAAALGGYRGVDVDYLSLFGIDPGDHYGDWLRGHIADAEVELWDDHGHYPHLVDPDRFVARLTSFWS